MSSRDHLFTKLKKGVVIKIAQRKKMHFIGGGGFLLFYWLNMLLRNSTDKGITFPFNCLLTVAKPTS